MVAATATIGGNDSQMNDETKKKQTLKAISKSAQPNLCEQLKLSLIEGEKGDL